jgi:uncharacterized protein
MNGDRDENRIGDWLQTYTGLKFYPMDPKSEEINIEDIAHSLGMQCRYNGHSLRFYSVAEHCVLISEYLSYDKTLSLYGLLHDAAEAYISDIPRPLKSHINNIKEIEKKIEKEIFKTFGLDPIIPKEIYEIDNRILNDERKQVMKFTYERWNIDPTPLGIEIFIWPPETATTRYLERFKNLRG